MRTGLAGTRGTIADALARATRFAAAALGPPRETRAAHRVKVRDMNANPLGTQDVIKFGFEVPQTFAQRADVEVIRGVAVAAEEAGFADVWLSDAATGGASLDPLTLLPFLAAITSRVRLGVSVLVLPVHHPLHLARRIATIDALSGGRLTVGVGLGGAWDPGYGVPPERRLAQFLDVFRGTDALLRGVAGEYKGEYNLGDTPSGPPTVQRPRPPIWFGATAEAAVRRAARLADGWMASGASDIETFERNVPILREELERAGRDPVVFPISKRVYFAMEAHSERRTEGGPRPVVWRNGGECVEYLTRLVQAGATHVLLNPVYDFEQQLDAVLPCLREVGTLS
jgi:alkanesulfonate monooxygenase SsuD/methylene tetrahydromethanopterin reductase-like flavin-dependent oxidoreductase (luciferase family)